MKRPAARTAPKPPKPVLVIYVKRDAESTKALKAFVAKHIAQICKFAEIKFIAADTAEILRSMKQQGITKTPTLIYQGKQFNKMDKIIAILTPPSAKRDGLGDSVSASDEYVRDYQMGILDDDEGEDQGDNMTEEEIRAKSAALQARRPVMSDEINSKSKVAGGRKITTRRPAAPAQQSFGDGFAGDDAFLKAAGRDNIEPTPVASSTDIDGDAFLEEYYLQLAGSQKKQSNRDWKRHLNKQDLR